MCLSFLNKASPSGMALQEPHNGMVFQPPHPQKNRPFRGVFSRAEHQGAGCQDQGQAILARQAMFPQNSSTRQLFGTQVLRGILDFLYFWGATTPQGTWLSNPGPSKLLSSTHKKPTVVARVSFAVPAHGARVEMHVKTNQPYFKTGLGAQPRLLVEEMGGHAQLWGFSRVVLRQNHPKRKKQTRKHGSNTGPILPNKVQLSSPSGLVVEVSTIGANGRVVLGQLQRAKGQYCFGPEKRRFQRRHEDALKRHHAKQLRIPRKREKQQTSHLGPTLKSITFNSRANIRVLDS